MQAIMMQVLIVDISDYSGVIRSLHGLDNTDWAVREADLIIDRDTGKILKSRHL